MIVKLSLRGLAAHKLRLGLTAAAVALGVSFISGTLIFGDTTTRSFDRLFAQAYSDVELVVEAQQAFSSFDSPVRPIPASLVTTLEEKVPEASIVYGVTEGYAAVVGADGKVVGGDGIPQVGGAWIDDPTSPMKMVTGHAPREFGEVVIDSVTAKAGGLKVGDDVQVLTQGATETWTLSGIFAFTPKSQLSGVMTFVAFVPEVAQELLVAPGHYSEILVYAKQGVSPDLLEQRVNAALPPGYQTSTGNREAEKAKAELKEFLDFVEIFLLVFAGVSVFVGSFIIFNTFSMLVAQRTRELALLRAVGASRRQVLFIVLGEAVGTGLIGSTLGVLAGGGLALGLRELIEQFGIRLPAAGVSISTPTIVWSYAVGMGVTVVASYFPARRAGKLPPVAAINDDIALPARSLRLRVVGGSVLFLFGVAVLALGFGRLGQAAADAASLVGLGTALIFIGVALLGPVVSRPITGVLGLPLARLAGTVGRMSRENARRNPRRTAATASALMIGLALVAMVSVLAQSMKASVDAAFERGFGADYTMTATGFNGFSSEAVKAVQAAPGVRSVTSVQYGLVQAGSERLQLLVADPAALAGPIKLKVESGTGSLGRDDLLVQRSAANQRGWRVGTTVAGQYPDGARTTLRVAGIIADTQLASRPFIMAPDSYQPHAPSRLVHLAYVDTNDEVRARRALESALAAYPNVNLQDRQQAKAAARKDVDQLLSMIILLLLLSIVIAALGIVNTLALSVIERTREIGLLRAVGMSRRQLRRMVRYESVVIAMYGAVLGLTLGVAFGWANQHALAKQGVEVLSIPYVQLALYAVAAAVVGVIAGIWPARRAARMDVLRAIATH